MANREADSPPLLFIHYIPTSIKKSGGRGFFPVLDPPSSAVYRVGETNFRRSLSLFFWEIVFCARAIETHSAEEEKKTARGEKERNFFFLSLPPVSSSVSRQFGPNSLNFFFPLPLSIPPPIRPSKLEGSKECCWLPLFFSPCSFRSLLRVSQLFFCPVGEGSIRVEHSPKQSLLSPVFQTNTASNM